MVLPPPPPWCLAGRTLRRSGPWLVLAFLSAVSCRKAEIQVYEAPKDEEEALRQQTPPRNAEAEAAPKLTWSLPEGWTHEPGTDAMNAAKFNAGAGADAVFVNATPLELMAGKEPLLVNMWRSVMGLETLSDADAAKALSEVEIGAQKGHIFEVSGSREGKEMKIITAFLHQSQRSWFFKIQGQPAAVDAQKPAFLAFLKSVGFESGSAAPPASASPPAAAASEPTQTKPVLPGVLPDGWTAVAPGPMQVAKYTVPAAADGQAEVTVSIFPSDTGGTAANVKRWRGQLQLPEVDDATAAAAAKPLEGGPPDSRLVELEHNGKALTGAIVPRATGWYFYKLYGHSAAVSAAREAFLNFAKAQP
ncbi:MAG: hypothetical protein KA004_03565 [Verrucomicrobiales bacterium]|nr:hypothetical protein [Verrucomicrobiales bacterium]